MRTWRLALSAGLLLLGRASQAQWVTVYGNAFDDGNLGPEISVTGSVLGSVAGLGLLAPFGGCASATYCTPSLGRPVAGAVVPYDNHVVTLNVGPLAPHSMARLRFSLLVLNTWDGNGPAFGPDYFVLGADGAERFRTTFNNFAGDPRNQSYPDPYLTVHPALTGAVEVGTLGMRSSVYELALTIPHVAAHVGFTIAAENLQGWSDEGWAVDNLYVDIFETAVAVPEPSTYVLMGTGLLALAGLARRRRAQD